MKQTIKNIGKALLGLVMPIKHQPLSDGWIKHNDKEIKKSVKNSSFRPPHFNKFNTTVKNDFKKTCLPNCEQPEIKLTTEQKLKDALDKLGSQPSYGKFEKSDTEYIKCDGTGQIFHTDQIYYYAPSDLHLSKKFFEEVTKEQLQSYFDIDNDDDFRAWVADKLLKVREF